MTDLGERALQVEIEHDNRSERRLVWQALLALTIVAIVIVVRQVFFL